MRLVCLTGQDTLWIFLLLELLRKCSALLNVQCRSFLTIMQYCQLCGSHTKPGLHGLLKLFDPSNPSTYQIFVMIFFLLRFSKFQSPHYNLTLKLSHQHCHLCWTNMLHSKTFRVHPRLKSLLSLLTFDLRKPNAQSLKLFTEDLGGPLIFKISESSRLLFINSYLTLDAHYRSLISACKDYPHKLWSTLNSLLSRICHHACLLFHVHLLLLPPF